MATHVSQSEPSPRPAPTLAQSLLDLESEGEALTEQHQVLAATIEHAVARWQAAPLAPAASESDVAARFFSVVDQTLTDDGFIFPPRGVVELLRQGLKARMLSQTEYALALTLPENRRRATLLQAIHARAAAFHLVDCDLAAAIYVSVAERLGFPVFMVWIPSHTFVRWSSPGCTQNWDPNFGQSCPDEVYAWQSGVTDEGCRHLGWLANAPRARIISYWLCNMGNWHKRHGRYAAALAAYRQAVRTDPTDLDAANCLAWFLATCEAPAYRDARESATIAQRLVALLPRGAWMQTLAAARAENGDFAAAIRAELNSSPGTAKAARGSGSSELVVRQDDAIRAYRLGLTYAQGIAAGIIDAPQDLLPYDE